VRPAPPIGSASRPGTSVAAASRPLALFLALLLGACAGPAAENRSPGITASFEDWRFKVEWGTAQTRSGQPIIAGYVTNTRGGGVNNIRMQAQTLDAQGQVIDTTTALAPGYVGGFGRLYFEVPLEKTGPGYRVSVLSWDPAGNGQ
jgi:hypothetical protein